MQVLTHQTSSQEKLDSICVWIRANAHKQIGWEELTKHSNLNHSHLMQLFKHINTTPMTYVRRVKDEEKLRDLEAVNLKQAQAAQNAVPLSLLKSYS